MRLIMIFGTRSTMRSDPSAFWCRANATVALSGTGALQLRESAECTTKSTLSSMTPVMIAGPNALNASQRNQTVDPLVM
ncbi:hypothetical protein DQ04_06071010 [Trypanosoma grayi]|uniref:hypothetical protein n=1 Tax=Trypanosoma grayi TaxID=71804 RepID=UPI0004F42974|nr:hypothetical protein DQ04_06071010 [Trypanosoma grayi]KEG08969.1 hypothetical protein DQ04_06071010 [Trypanosoma grayi]